MQYRLDGLDVLLEQDDARLETSNLGFASIDLVVVVVDLHQVFLLLVGVFFLSGGQLIDLILGLLDFLI